MTDPNNPADSLRTVPLSLIAADLLKQFNKPTLFGKHGLTFSKAEIDHIAAQIEAQQPVEQAFAVCAGLAALIAESEAELQARFGMDFARSLATQDLRNVGGWETTAEFLEIANHKSNAELRISAGATLMLLLGDARPAPHLFTLLQVDGGADDVDALLAKRALAHHTGIVLDTPDWEAQVRRVFNAE